MKRKILVLEDEENIRSFLVLNLKRSGYEVIEAETGEIALEKYHENQDIAVAVLDVMLPGIDGYEVCRAMRGAGYQAGVIMLTARTQIELERTGLDHVILGERRTGYAAVQRVHTSRQFNNRKRLGDIIVRTVQAQSACPRGAQERCEDRADAD